MGWPYEYVAELPADVYAELVAMLNEDAARAKVANDNADAPTPPDLD
jgi:hypothetical protein